MIKKSFILILFLLPLVSNAQFGIRTSFNLNETPEWDNYFTSIDGQNRDVFNNSYSVLVDYWLRLPNHRIEFYPNISYQFAKSKLSGDLTQFQLGLGPDLSLRQIGAGLITHFYLLDMIGDCDCPTFSKQGGLFKKGFFLMAGIGADYAQKSIAGNGFKDGNFDLKFSGGLGLDIGITDLVTISPFLQYQYYPSMSWHEIGTPFNQADTHIESAMSQIQLGIRIGLRPDYKKF